MWLSELQSAEIRVGDAALLASPRLAKRSGVWQQIETEIAFACSLNRVSQDTQI